MNSIVVTGATGNVGQEVVRALLRRGVCVTAADYRNNRNDRASALLRQSLHGSHLRRFLKDGQITLTPEPFRDAEAYIARAEFLPLVMLTDKAETAVTVPLEVQLA